MRVKINFIIAAIIFSTILYSSLCLGANDDPPIGGVPIKIDYKIRKNTQVLLDEVILVSTNNDLLELGIGFKNINDTTAYFDPNAFDKLKEFLKRILDDNEIIEWTNASIDMKYTGIDHKLWLLIYSVRLKAAERNEPVEIIIVLKTASVI